jgi:ubiquitin-protein ligase
MIVTINELTTKRSVRLEVEPGHTVRVVVEEVLKTLKVPATTTYRLVLGGKEIGPELFDKTLGELGISDGAIMDLVPRPVGGAVLPHEKLLKRLSREEKELNEQGLQFTRSEVWCMLNFPMIYSQGYEALDVAVKYTVNFNARGFILTKKGVIEQLNHTASIYVLRFYPYLDPKSGAPVRIFWESNIFHPNICPGPKYGGDGSVCWKMIREWGKNFSLATLVKGLQLLVENPNPDDALNRIPICVQAASFFKDNPHLTGSYRAMKVRRPQVVGIGDF